MKTCLFCGKKVKRNSRTFCSNKCRGKHLESLNPFKEFEIKCDSCGKIFSTIEREKTFLSKKNHYCSRSCANKRIHSDETKLKIGDGIKKAYEKDPTYKIRCIDNNKRNELINGHYQKIETVCIGCGKIFMKNQCLKKRKFCSRECFNKNIKRLYKELNPSAGGYRGASPEISKCGWYKGYWCDSSWELAWIVYNLDHNIKFERNHDKFEYTYNGNKLNYIPDFKFENYFIEIKGFETKKDKEKIKNFPHKLLILRKEEMYPYLKYVY